jgi:hypothetical protein
MGRVQLDETRRNEVFAYHRQAEQFWRDVLGRANAE